MLSWIVFFALFCAVAILAAVTTYWQDIIAQPDSAAAFLGALAGAGGGLLAIILGALLNAELNRRRDDRLRDEERKAAAIEIQGDLVALRLLVKVGLRAIVRFAAENRGLKAYTIEVLALPPQDFLKNAPGRLGFLGSDVALRVLVVHAEANRLRNIFKALLARGPEHPIPSEELKALSKSYALLVRDCERAIQALEDITGRAFPPERLATEKAGSAPSGVERPEVTPK